MTTTTTTKIAELNDRLRKGDLSVGQINISGFIKLDYRLLLPAIAEFNGFTEDNDPYDEHDFGKFISHGDEYFFKIDYYDLNLEYASPDPADPMVTKRVLTIMLAGDY